MSEVDRWLLSPDSPIYSPVFTLILLELGIIQCYNLKDTTDEIEIKIS